MTRKNRKGWFNDPDRHALASKGIQTTSKSEMKSCGTPERDIEDKFWNNDRTQMIINDLYEYNPNEDIAYYIKQNYDIFHEYHIPDEGFETVEVEIDSTLYGEKIFISYPHDRDTYLEESYFIPHRRTIHDDADNLLLEWMHEHDIYDKVDRDVEDDKIEELLSKYEFEEWARRTISENWAYSYLEELKDNGLEVVEK